MGLYIKNWSLADWKELLKWAKIGANNAMMGEFTEVEEVPPHGRLIDADALTQKIVKEHDKYDAMNQYDSGLRAGYRASMKTVRIAPTILEAEEGE